MKLSHAKRRAYGRLCITAFLLIQSIAHSTIRWDIEYSDALTDKEKQLMNMLAGKLNKDATLLREFGNRLTR